MKRRRRVSGGILLAFYCLLGLCAPMVVWKIWLIVRPTWGYSIPLVDAARSGEWEEVKRLLEQGDDPNETSDLQNYHTALYWAINSERTDVVEALIKHNIRLDHDDYEAIRDLQWRKQHPGIAHILDKAEGKIR